MSRSWSFYKDTINDWLDDFKLRSGGTKHNVTFLREFKCLESEMSAIMCYLYFLANHINNRYASSILKSFIRQKKFVKRVKLTLKEKAKKEKAERKAMEKECIANHNKHMAEYRKLERSFNRYYEGNY